MGKHSATSVAHMPTPAGVLDAIVCCFDDEPERTLGALCVAAAPFVCHQLRFAAFREWVKEHPRFMNAFATDEEKAARGLQEVVLAVLRPYQEEGAATFKGVCPLCGGGSVVLTPKYSTDLRVRIRCLNATKASACRACVAQLADGRWHTEASLMQRLWRAMREQGWHELIRRLIVDTGLERLANSPDYRTETKDGMRRFRLKVNSLPAGGKKPARGRR